MAQNNNEETIKCVETIVKKTIIGYIAPASLFLIVRSGRFVHNMMLVGAGFGLGHSLNDCSRNQKCSFKDSLPSFMVSENKCCPKTSCCSTTDMPKCTKNSITTITTEAKQE